MQGRVHRQPHMRALGPAVNQQVVVRRRKAHRPWLDGVFVVRLAQRQGAAGLKNLHQQAAPVPGQVQHHEHRRLQCGGPGNATTFLSQYLTTKAVGQFDLGPAAAFSLIYFFIILLLCFILYNWMQRVGTVSDEGAGHE